MNMLNLKSVDKSTNISLITQEVHLSRIILHWSKILKNNNVHLYYDYVENSVLSYDEIINNPELESYSKELLTGEFRNVKKI